MNKSRIKLTAPSIATRAHAESMVRQICELKIEYAQAEAAMNEAVLEAKKAFEQKFAPIQKQILEKSELVQNWAEANPAEFNGAKSVDMVHAQIGWRTGQPQLKTLSGWTWDRVLEKIKDLGGSALAYLRQKTEVNKQQLLADRETLGPEQLRLMGVKVIQEEAFFIEPKLEQTENRIVTTAA